MGDIMYRAAFTILVLITPQAYAQTDSPWLNWVAAHSPNGFDLTPDGTIWINIAKPGQKDDYAIRAGDLQEARNTNNRTPSFWVRGYHKLNPKVHFRETKARYTLDCVKETLSRSMIAYYNADGTLLGQSGYSPDEYIIPGSYGAEYFRLFCLSS